MRIAIAVVLFLANPAVAEPQCRCTPGKACWPAPAEWQKLAASLHGKLEKSPPLPARSDNPYLLQDQASGTQTRAWIDAWTAAPSAYAVVAADSADVVAAVNFARTHHLRIVVKGTGHDYLGRSNAPDSLLVWTHALRDISSQDAFVPRGCSTAPRPAVTVGAGTRWLEAYQEVMVKNGRYVQGGGCTSVGAAGGFLQGGGFGSFSKQFGIAAASLLEAEVVTADGKLLVANACQNPVLFWALKGGGGGTWGVVTRVTLATHALPATFGGVEGSIKARDDKSFEQLLERFFAFYREKLANEHWGEQVKIRRSNTLEFSLNESGLGKKEIETIFAPFRAWAEKNPALETKLEYYDVPGRKLWDYAFLHEHAPNDVKLDPRSEKSANPRWWWSGDGEQVAMYLYAYQSRWLPLSLFEPANVARLAHGMFEASRQFTVGIHFNKGQAGASAEAIARDKETAMNPSVLEAAALVIVADGDPEPDRDKAARTRASVAAAMKPINELARGAGSYVNETDYFEPDWQQSFWGRNYPSLSQIKQKYDPDGLFWCHHCVGSEAWSGDGMCRAK